MFFGVKIYYFLHLIGKISLHTNGIFCIFQQAPENTPPAQGGTRLFSLNVYGREITNDGKSRTYVHRIRKRPCKTGCISVRKGAFSCVALATATLFQ